MIEHGGYKGVDWGLSGLSWEMHTSQLEQKAWLFDIQYFERLEETLWDFFLHLKETTF